MIAVQVQIKGLDALRANFQRAPSLTLKYLALATRAAIHEIESNVDEGGIMQFKTPRSRRTGQLVARFGLNRRLEKGGLRGSTGPTVNYASHVYFGTRRSGPNKYMDRIAAKSTAGVNKHFNDAAEQIVKALAK
jgi:hypothetical protein